MTRSQEYRRSGLLASEQNSFRTAAELYVRQIEVNPKIKLEIRASFSKKRRAFFSYDEYTASSVNIAANCYSYRKT